MNMKRNASQRGAVSVLAMLFLAIFASLAAAMAMSAQTNLLSADTNHHGNRALAASETGVQFARFRLASIADGVTTTKGEIEGDIADDLWTQVAMQLYTAVGVESQFLDSPTISYDGEGVPQKVELGRIRLGGATDDPTFRVTVEQHPIDGENYGSAYYQRTPYNVGGAANLYTADGEAVTSANPVTNNYVRVTTVGTDGGVNRTINIDFRIDKKVRFAILSRNRIMIGRNVMVVGPIGSRYTQVDHLHGHPIQMRDNFHGLDPTLDTWLADLKTYLGLNDVDGDNRVLVADERESAGLGDAAALDANNDGYVDTYDMFVLKYDSNNDGALSESEFSSGGNLIDGQLWQLMNEAKYPIGTEFDWANKRVKLPGESWVDASADLSTIDNYDDYAKVAGDVVFKSEKSPWEAGAAGGKYQDYFRGPIVSDEYTDPVTFGADDSAIVSLDASNFDVSQYRSMATGSFTDQINNPVANDGSQPTVITPAGPGTIESVPYNSPYPYDYYARPVYENMVFTNVKIPKGTNALFVDCKFIGVTFVDSEVDNDDPNFNYAGMQEADGSQKYHGIEVDVNGSAVTDTKPLGNNIRFHNCDFDGTVATENPASYSHVRNKLQFTGDTVFNPTAGSLTDAQKALFEKSTIMAPQYSLDIGTFTQPASGTEVTHLDGTIVAGVLDIRGQAEINGSLITTFEPTVGQGVLAEGGNPANFNTTLGYFESTAGDSEAEMPVGGYGKIIIRYDPYRAMPDGILGPIEVTADMDTYFEGTGQ